MPDRVVQPTRKFAKLGYLLVLGWLAVSALVLLASRLPVWPPLVLAVLTLLWALIQQARTRMTRTVISGDKLRLESGLLGRSSRTVPLAKVQDVRVDQTLLQRLIGIGSVSVETAGEASRLTLANIDQPQEVADLILDAAQRESQGPPWRYA